MRKIFTFSMLMLLFILIVSCEKHKGRGDYIDETRLLQPFSGIKVSMDCDVDLVEFRDLKNGSDQECINPVIIFNHANYVSSDSLYSIKIQAQDNLHQYIETRVSGGILHISISDNEILKKHDRIKIKVTAPDYGQIIINTPGNVNLRLQDEIVRPFLDCIVGSTGTLNLNNLRYQHVKIQVTGSGYVMTDGIGNIQKAVLSTANNGKIDLFNLTIDSSWASTQGSGDISVTVKEYLNGTILKAGNIYYRGNPKTVIQTNTGTGKLIPL